MAFRIKIFYSLFFFSALFLSLLGLCILASCAHEEPSLDKLGLAKGYDTAVKYMKHGQYETANDLFSQIELQYPYSPLSRKSLTMEIFTNYKLAKYTNTINAAERYLTLYHNQKGSPYARYMIAQSYYEQINGAARSQKITKNALESFLSLTALYPFSAYTKDARQKVIVLEDTLAAHDMFIGRFYERKKYYLASLKRFKNIVDRYSTTNQTPEALERMVEVYVALGISEEAQKTAAILGYNYPRSFWYIKAYDILAANGIVNVSQELGSRKSLLAKNNTKLQISESFKNKFP